MDPLVDAYYKGRAKLKKRATHQFFDNFDKPKAACYLGAVYFGLYNKTSTHPIDDMIMDGYTQLRRWAEPPCDHDLDNAGTLAGIIIHLTDFHDGRQFSEEKITDWFSIALQNSCTSQEELIRKNT